MPTRTATSRTPRQEARRERARELLTTIHVGRMAAERKADRERQREFRGILKAHAAGLTYEEIHDIVELSNIRVSQILREQRELSESNGAA